MGRIANCTQHSRTLRTEKLMEGTVHVSEVLGGGQFFKGNEVLPGLHGKHEWLSKIGLLTGI